jgi:hypothetical protein
LPSRGFLSRGGGLAGVVGHRRVQRVADASLERAQRLFRGRALGDLAVEEGAALAVTEPDLSHRGHVDGVVQLTVPAPREAVGLATSRRHLDGGGAVEGGEAIPAGEAGDIAGDAHHRGGHHGADTEDLGGRGLRRGHDRGQALLGLGPLSVDTAQVL